MAKSKKGTGSTQSNTGKPKKAKLPRKRKLQAMPQLALEMFEREITTPSGRKFVQKYFRKPRVARASDAPCTGCCCDGLSSGGIFTCEDNGCVYIPKPDYFAVLVDDPNFALPYWAAPTDLGLICGTVPPPTPISLITPK